MNTLKPNNLTSKQKSQVSNLGLWLQELGYTYCMLALLLDDFYEFEYKGFTGFGVKFVLSRPGYILKVVCICLIKFNMVCVCVCVCVIGHCLPKFQEK